MINIVHKYDCCGCNACVQRCPKHCISMQEDDEGFTYPVVDKSACINCGLCEKVCPVINQNKAREPLNCYAAINPDEQIRMQSSSGGIFTLLAEKIIDNGGVVFGAMWDENWNVKHSYIENKSDLKLFRGSKYLQSSIGDTYIQAEQFLQNGRQVLFSGTPCQIAGLKQFLNKIYDNLIAIDFICHGVPSSAVFQRYIMEELHEACNLNAKILPSAKGTITNNIKIKSINFRDKTTGWKNFSFTVKASIHTLSDGKEKTITLSSTLHDNPFIKGFLNNYYLRPSCHKCPAKKFKSGADITIGDYWGFNSTDLLKDDDKGISAVIVTTPKGKKAIGEIGMLCSIANYSDILHKNNAIEQSAKGPYRKYFYAHKTKSFKSIIEYLTSKNIFIKIKRKLYLKTHKNEYN